MNGSYYTADRGDIVDFLRSHGPFNKALDIGCAAGRLGGQLRAAGIVNSCDGIEPHPTAAKMASNQLQQVWHCDLADALSEAPWVDYDLFILADVLEHLVDPWQTLRDIHDRARPSARLMVSAPNVRHKSVVFPLLFLGRFDYVDAGIMDRTHLHFFTPASLRQTVEATGWRVRAESLNIKKKYRKWWFPHRLLGQFLAVQCFLLAEK
jgi:2-polyprenyl-3-methyl-5-hydroxy-6-metoxy-1,4-benzoquinol methylase